MSPARSKKTATPSPAGPEPEAGATLPKATVAAATAAAGDEIETTTGAATTGETHPEPAGGPAGGGAEAATEDAADKVTRPTQVPQDGNGSDVDDVEPPQEQPTTDGRAASAGGSTTPAEPDQTDADSSPTAAPTSPGDRTTATEPVGTEGGASGTAAAAAGSEAGAPVGADAGEPARSPGVATSDVEAAAGAPAGRSGAEAQGATDATAGAGEAEGRRGRRPRWDPRGWPGWVVPAAVVGLVMAVPLYGMVRAPGQPMEEGFMLVFPERLLHGDMPHKDFLHLYGPGSLWVLAGFFKVLGVDLWVERLVGFVQIAGLVAGVTVAGYRWGRWPAVVGGITAAILIIPPTSLTALAWPGGVALALAAVLVTVRAVDIDDDERHRRRALVGGGLLAGAALLFRPDLVVALTLPLGALWLWGLDRAGRRQLAAGLGLGVSPYLLHLLLSGPGDAVTGMVTEPVFELRPGRRLPFPPPSDDISSFLNRAVVFRNWRWPFPALEESQQVFVWVPILFAVCAVLLYIAVTSYRSRSPRGWLLLTLALLSLGILPQVVQRADTAHLAWVSALPFGVLPAALVEWSQLRKGHAWLRTGLTLLPLGILLVVVPHFTVRWYADYSGRTFGYRVDSWAIENRGRTFYYGRPDVARAAEDLLADVEEVTEPGQRLIVGPGDFRRTPYSEAWLYFLLPQLEPGTRYIEMDPGIANADESGLADELRHSDVVILSTTYDNWVEPNTSVDYGSDEPNQVLEEDYCLHGRYGTSDFDPDRGFYELYLRC